MPQGLCAEANTPFRGCRSQVTLGGGARETTYLKAPPQKPRRHCLSPGRSLRKLRSGKVGCKLPVSSSGERNHAFLEQEEATAVFTRPLEGHQLFQEGLSFRVMTLSSDRAGEGPVEMAEHTSECTPDPLQVAETELNPGISSPRGVNTLILAPARMQQALSRAGDAHCATPAGPAEAESSKGGHKTGSCSAATAGCGAPGSTHPHFGSPRLWGTAKQQPPVLPAAFWGAQPCLHPPAAPLNLSRGERRVGGAWLFGRAAFVQSWGRAGSECACGSPRSPCKDGGLPCRRATSTASSEITAQKQQLSINSERPSGSTGNYARICMGKKKKIRGDF